MAENPKNQPEDKAGADGEQAAPKRSRTGLLIGGSAALLLGLAYLAATLALPSKPEELELQGPFVGPLSAGEIQLNLAGNNSKRFLVMSLNAEYMAFEEGYFAGRQEDPLYTVMLKDAILDCATTKTLDDVTDNTLVSAFLEEIVQNVEPVIFPLQLGSATHAGERDAQSGLALGTRSDASTLRGLASEHQLHVDALARTIALDDGARVSFEGSERDLVLSNAQGAIVHVDVAHLTPGFKGSVPIGVHGRVRRIFRDTWLIQ
jgi:hypothetical protein